LPFSRTLQSTYRPNSSSGIPKIRKKKVGQTQQAIRNLEREIQKVNNKMEVTTRVNKPVNRPTLEVSIPTAEETSDIIDINASM
jgi:hypothetical protein